MNRSSTIKKNHRYGYEGNPDEREQNPSRMEIWLAFPDQKLVLLEMWRRFRQHVTYSWMGQVLLGPSLDSQIAPGEHFGA